MKKLLFILFISLFFVIDVNAVTLVDKIDMKISVSGLFLSLNDSSSYSAYGYSLIDNSMYDSYALPNVPDYKYGTYGGALTQCGMSFISGNYYSVTYYFAMTESSQYLHPTYSSYPYKVGIGTNNGNANLDTNYTSVSSGVELYTVSNVSTPFGNVVGAFTVIFQAQETGTCVNIVYSSQNHNTYASEVGFLGYNYEDLGAKPLSEEDITNAMNNALNNALGGLEEEQQATNDKLDDLKEEENETQGLLGGIIDTIVSIPKSIADFLGDMLQGLFIPTEEQFQELIEKSQTLSENFGFVGQSFGYAVSFLNEAINGLRLKPDLIQFPGLEIGDTTLFEGFTLIPQEYIDIQDNELLYGQGTNSYLIRRNIQNFTSIFLVGLFISWGFKEYYRVMSKTTEVSDGVTDSASAVATDVKERYNQESRLRRLSSKKNKS